jgi:NAD(P)-dependent dehydrogenase (short-subunit alcohol dehydrogenase family)
MVFNMTEEEWDDVIAVHLKGTFTVCKFASILFRQQRSGRIITFASESGLFGNTGQANYGAAKSGIAGFTKVVARDLGRYGRVGPVRQHRTGQLRRRQVRHRRFHEGSRQRPRTLRRHRQLDLPQGSIAHDRHRTGRSTADEIDPV